MTKLLIYDLDGTLIDSAQDIANAVNWTLKEMGLRRLSLDEIRSFIGTGVEELMRRTLDEALSGEKTLGEENEVAALLERSSQLYRSHYASHLLDETQLYPSVRMVLEYFKDRKQAVITNKPEGFSRKILRGLGIDSYFFRVIGGDQAFPKKPAPAAVLEIVGSAGIGPAEAVLIGDSAIDIETGKNAGVKTVAVTYGFRSRPEIERAQPDLIVGDLSELTTRFL